MGSLLIRGGILVTPEVTARRPEPASTERGRRVGERGDVLIEGKTIAAVGPHLPRTAATRVVDANGLLVLPGLVDPHVHLREPGDTHKEDFASGTAAALAGGFTTVLAMPNTRPPITDRATLEEATRLAATKAVCDVGLFVGATPHNAADVAGLTGSVGLKVYMGATTGDLLVADLDALLAHFSTYPSERALAVHAEDAEAVAWFAARGQRRPPLCALLALARALALASHYRRRLHVCHVSTGAELALIRAARSLGVRVTCEVTPHHLFLTTDDTARLGLLARVNPPLRSADDAAALWAGLGDVDCLATDHAPHTLEEKRSPRPPAGMPGLETALPLLLSAVFEGRLSLRKGVRLMAEGPARAFGLARKGCLAPGCDADLALVDHNAEWTIGERALLTRCGWSPFAGWQVKGRVERVFLRGQEVYAYGNVLVQPGYGRIVVTSFPL